MSLNIGASCVGRYFWFTTDCKVVEARILQNNEHPHFWEAVDICLKNKIKLIATIDTYLTGSRWNPTDNELSSFVNWLCNELISSGANKSNCVFSWDNEPEEYCTPQIYTKRLNIIHSAIAGRFDLIAGNTQASLSFIDYVCSAGKFEILGVHFQSSATTPESIEYLGNEYKRLALSYKKRLTCTEANWFDVSKPEGYQMLLKQLIKAESIGCEDFCVAVINQTFGYQNAPDDDSNPWLAFLTDGKIRSPYWNDFVRIINEKAPKGIIDMFDLNYVKPGSKNEETRAIQQIMIDEGYDLGSYGADGIYGAKTKEAILKWQTDNNLKVDGIVGKETWYWITGNIPSGARRFLQLIVRKANFK